MKLWIAAIWLLATLMIGVTANISRANDATVDSEPPGAETSGDDLKYAPAAWPDAPDAASMLRRLVLGTVTVLGLCVCTIWGGKRWLGGAPARANSGAMLRLVETVSLGNRCSVHLLQAGDHQVLVGVDGGGVKSLVPLPMSFDQAIANVGSPNIETVVDLEQRELRIPMHERHS